MNRTALDFQLTEALHWWIDVRRCLLASREVLCNLQHLPHHLSYSDVEGSDAGVGVAEWGREGSLEVLSFRIFTGPSWNPSAVEPEHGASRQELLGTDGIDISLTIFSSMLSGEEHVVNAREELLEATCGFGWCDSSVSLLSLLLVDEVPVLFLHLSTVFTLECVLARPDHLFGAMFSKSFV